jgi:hydroxymethylglutaryl-CoA lyase
VERVVDISRWLVDAGLYQLSLGDTIGVGTPGQTARILEALLKLIPVQKLALHLHDTRGTALANVLMALQLGVSTFDASAGGLGGCPYAPGATGNLATEDLVYMLDGLGIESGVSLEALVAASLFIEEKIGHPLASRYTAAYKATHTAR